MRLSGDKLATAMMSKMIQERIHHRRYRLSPSHEQSDTILQWRNKRPVMLHAELLQLDNKSQHDLEGQVSTISVQRFDSAPLRIMPNDSATSNFYSRRDSLPAENQQQIENQAVEMDPRR